MAIQRYAGDKFTGLSTDTKPSEVLDGAIFWETDTLNYYIKVGGSWTVSPFLYRDGSNANTTINIQSEELVNVSRLGVGVVTALAKAHIKGTADEIQQIIQTNTIQNENIWEVQDVNGIEQTYIKPNFGLATGGDRIKSTETITTTSTISDSVEEIEFNSSSDITVTMPTGANVKVISMVNIGAGKVALLGSINEASALTYLNTGESCVYKYSTTNSKWN